MIQLAIIGFLVGAVFGLRFKVLALLPLTAMGAAAIGAGALLVNQSVAVLLSGVVVWALALQAGFLLGSLSRFTVAAARSAPAPKQSTVEIAR